MLACRITSLGLCRLCKQTPLTPKDGTQTLIVRKILERSQLVGEVGAALLVTPNGSRVLRDLGFSFEKAQANRMTRWEVLDGLDLKTVASTDLEDAEQVYGAPVFTMHRADLHNELMRVAKSTSSDLPPVSLSAASKVKSADPSKGVVELDDGSCLHADLIVGADGLHSAVRSCVLDYHEEFKSRPSGISAFRFQIPTAQLYDNQHFRDLLKFKGRGSTVLVDTAELDVERHLVWYDCQDGQTQNFVGVHKAFNGPRQDLKTEMMKEFGHFHPSVVGMISAAPVMLPFGGQGSNQAIEDAGALGVLFRNMQSLHDVPTRLQMFEDVRRLRASRVQTLSKVRLGKEKDVELELRKFADPPDSGMVCSLHCVTLAVLMK
ncbi:MAG: hypothetical protein Q9162_006626 [Coniocarpon cinnabarinum]